MPNTIHLQYMYMFMHASANKEVFLGLLFCNRFSSDIFSLDFPCKCVENSPVHMYKFTFFCNR